ncbi:YybS family protein [Bacillus sp. REN16]|uniref:YybS family protein n=1 Tax=Bacillus sp. REN16 TaxID=2887296 RepID=UPI001E28D871|nr:YybS family protein [Bacillus sp. REN16]MCC3358994.1 YybS family protein [Bacillus sp. REN16]
MKNAKILTEGAMLLAVYSVLLLLTLYIPILGFVLSFILPIPFILFTVKYRVKQSLLFILIAFLLSGLLGSVFGIIHTLMFGISGILLGELISRGRSGIELFLGSCLSYLFSIVILYVIAVLVLQIDVFDMIRESSRESFAMAESIMRATGGEVNKEAIAQLEESIDMMQYMIPSMFVLIAMFLAFVTVVAMKPVLVRLQVKMNPFPPFREITFPKSILWYYLLILLFSFVEMEKGTFGYTAFLNLFFVLQMFMVVQGLAFIYYFCHQKGITKAVPVVLTILTPFLLYIIRILGIIDLGFQLRNRISGKKK